MDMISFLERIKQIVSTRDALNALMDHQFTQLLIQASCDQTHEYQLYANKLSDNSKTALIAGLGWLLPLSSSLLSGCLFSPAFIEKFSANQIQAALGCSVESFHHIVDELLGSSLEHHLIELEDKSCRLDHDLDHLNEEQLHLRKKIALKKEKSEQLAQQLNIRQSEQKQLLEQYENLTAQLNHQQTDLSDKEEESIRLQREISRTNNGIAKTEKEGGRSNQLLQGLLKEAAVKKRQLQQMEASGVQDELLKKLDSVLEEIRKACPSPEIAAILNHAGDNRE